MRRQRRRLPLTGVNFGRDLPEPERYVDIRNVVEGDPSPDGKGKLSICRGIEVGHIFQLRTKYSEAMNATFLDESGQSNPMEMGCYGIGVSRIVAAAIEQNNDARGILWPLPIAPFQVAIAPIGWGKSAEVRALAERLHDELAAAGIEVLLDDRDERPGVMFADLELIGIPHRITVGERSLKQGQVEYQARAMRNRSGRRERGCRFRRGLSRDASSARLASCLSRRCCRQRLWPGRSATSRWRPACRRRCTPRSPTAPPEARVRHGGRGRPVALRRCRSG